MASGSPRSFALIGPRRPRRRRASLVGLVLVGALVAIVAPAPPAGAAIATLAPAGSIARTLGGLYVGGGTREAFSTPAIADVTGDGRADLVAAGLDGTVQAYALPSRTRIWTVSVGRTAIQSSPAIADLTGDKKADVIVGTMDGRLLILDGPSGRVVRTFSQGAPLHCPPG